MASKKKSDYAPHRAPDAAPICQWEGCAEAGIYKAPKSKEELQNYLWFCLEHIRQHNQQWDFFAGLDREEIESFIKDATYGHRPTWTRESRMSQRHYRQLQDALYEFLHPGAKPPKPAPPVSAKLRRALALLEMDYPYTLPALKSRYRVLVKKHHPDVNKGNKMSEEKFKQITAAYHQLTEHLQPKR